MSHVLKNVSETKQLTLMAQVHQIGVYDLNQMYFEVITAKGSEPTVFRLKDEMILEAVEQAQLIEL